MEWFRFYHDVLHDPKVQKLSPEMFKNWINVLCIASKNEVRGGLPDVAGVAFGLRTKPCKADTILRKLVYAGLLEGEDLDHLEVHNWNGRQRPSDDPAPRKAKSREQKKADGVLTASAPRPDGNELETFAEPQENAIHAQNGPNVTGQSRDSHALEKSREEKNNPPTPLTGGEPAKPDKPKGERAAPRRRIPEDWKPSSQAVETCRKNYPGVTKEQIRASVYEFRGYWLSEGKVKADWDQAWHNSLAKHDPRILPAHPNGNGTPPVPSLPDPDVLLRRQMEADERRRQEQARIARGER